MVCTWKCTSVSSHLGRYPFTHSSLYSSCKYAISTIYYMSTGNIGFRFWIYFRFLTPILQIYMYSKTSSCIRHVFHVHFSIGKLERDYKTKYFWKLQNISLAYYNIHVCILIYACPAAMPLRGCWIRLVKSFFFYFLSFHPYHSHSLILTL